jgi:uncharacterized protein
MPVDPAIRSHIKAVLNGVAASEGVRILYAAESGSRAWGFGSPDSDYDVRFIYAHPADWYLRLHDARDVIERPLDNQLVDLAGWDVRKALRLLLRSNPALNEWLCSPVVYADDGEFRDASQALFTAHCSRNAIAHHYHSIARGQWKAEIEGRDRVKLKKYFYIVRPLLSLAWVAQHDEPPPMALQALLEASALSPTMRAAIEALRIKKRDTPEMGLEPRIEAIDTWALGELARLDPAGLGLPEGAGQATEAQADELFQRTIGFRR